MRHEREKDALRSNQEKALGLAKAALLWRARWDESGHWAEAGPVL
jgi:hypothetical protein